MQSSSPRVELRTFLGSPIQAGGMRITLQSQALTVRLPFYHFVYNRPAAVLVESAGETRRIPIVDVTRLVLIGLAVISILIPIIAAIQVKIKQEVRTDD